MRTTARAFCQCPKKRKQRGVASSKEVSQELGDRLVTLSPLPSQIAAILQIGRFQAGAQWVQTYFAPRLRLLPAEPCAGAGAAADGAGAGAAVNGAGAGTLPLPPLDTDTPPDSCCLDDRVCLPGVTGPAAEDAASSPAGSGSSSESAALQVGCRSRRTDSYCALAAPDK